MLDNTRQHTVVDYFSKCVDFLSAYFQMSSSLSVLQPCGRPKRLWRTSAPLWRFFRRGQPSFRPVYLRSGPLFPTLYQTLPALMELCRPPVTPSAPRSPSWESTLTTLRYQELKIASQSTQLKMETSILNGHFY